MVVPEDLPIDVALSLAYTSDKMMKKQNLVMHLDVCATMEYASTICIDKVSLLLFECSQLPSMSQISPYLSPNCMPVPTCIHHKNGLFVQSSGCSLGVFREE